MTRCARIPNVSNTAATGATISFPNALESNEGDYFVIVTNAAGSATSQVARLTVKLPPLLLPVANQVIHQGMTLSLVQSATDPDLPPDLLTHALLNAPAGAIINPTNGTITWTPGLDRVNTTNMIIAKVTDNGVPNLSAINSFMVAIASRPVILSIAPTTNGINITWSSIPGINYRLQSQTNILAGDWNNASNSVSASSSLTTQSITTPNQAQRFYRIQVIP